MEGIDEIDENDAPLRSIIAVAGVHAAGKTHVIRSLQSGAVPSPLQLAGLTGHELIKEERFAKRRRKRVLKDVILHLNIHASPRRDFAQELRPQLLAAEQLRVITVLSDPAVVRARLAERERRWRGRGPGGLMARLLEAFDAEALAEEYDRWFQVADGLGPLEHVLVDSTGPGLQAFRREDWENAIRPRWASSQ